MNKTPILALLLVLAFELSCENKQPPASTSQSVPPKPTVHAVQLKIGKPRPGETLPVVESVQGDIVSIVISSEYSGRLEIHGYNQGIDVPANQEVTLSFSANHSGWFPIHLHPSPDVHQEVGALEITPR